MTIDQLREILAKKVLGQGDAIDIGGGVAIILGELLDKVTPSNIIEEMKINISEDIASASDLTKAACAEALGISEDQLDALMDGEYLQASIDGLNYSIQIGGTSASIGVDEITIVNNDGVYTIIVS